jgi:hypothetical protein
MSLVDDAGKEWTFEFCFWYSKESRIYYFKQGIYEVVTQVQKFLSRIPEFFFLDLVVPGCTDQT